MKPWTILVVALSACAGTTKYPAPTTGVPTAGAPAGTPTGTTPTTGAAGPARGLPEGLIATFEGDCPAGWSEWAPAVGRALVAASNGSEVGLVSGVALDDVAPEAHAHGVSGEIVLPGAGISGLSSCCNGSPGASGSYALSGATDPADAGVPTVARRICRNDVASDGELGHSLPSGAVAFVDDAECPSGMVRLANSGGYVVIGTDDPTAVGMGIGTPLGPGEDREHDHDLIAQVDVPVSPLAAASGGNNDTAAAGVASAYVVSGPASSGLPTVGALLCTVFQEVPAEGGADVEVPAGGAIWSQVDCPVGWSSVNPLIGRIAVGAAPGVTPGATHGEPLPPMTLPRHGHVGTTSVSVPSRQVALASGCCNYGNGGNGTFTVELETEEAAIDLPLLHLRACAR